MLLNRMAFARGAGLLLITVTMNSGAGERIPVIERDGREYVSGALLQREWKVAVKSLPGQEQMVLCRQDRCALLKDHRVGEEGEILVGLEAMTKLLSLRIERSADGRRVGFAEQAGISRGEDELTQVGELAPNFRLNRLDGGTVSLGELRAKRVLINSWASW